MYIITIGIFILVIPFIVMPRDIKKGELNPYYVVLRSIITTLSAVLVLFVVIRFSGQGLFNHLHEYMKETVSIMVQNDNVLQMFGLSDKDTNAAETTLLAVYDKLLSQIPGYIIAASGVWSYFAYIIISKSQKKRNPLANIKLMPKFKEFTFPPYTCMAMVLMYFAALLISKAELFPNDFIYQNINYLFDLVFMVQGFSVIFMICDLKRIPKAVAIILVLVFWNFFMLRQLMVFLGMIDMIVGVKAFLIFKDQMKSQNGGRPRNRRKK